MNADLEQFLELEEMYIKTDFDTYGLDRSKNCNQYDYDFGSLSFEEFLKQLNDILLNDVDSSLDPVCCFGVPYFDNPFIIIRYNTFEGMMLMHYKFGDNDPKAAFSKYADKYDHICLVVEANPDMWIMEMGSI